MVINGQMGGWFAFLWDEYISNFSEEQTMVQILQIVKDRIHHKGEYISLAELQAIPTMDDHFKLFYNKPFPTADLIRILDALIRMLQEIGSMKIMICISITIILLFEIELIGLLLEFNIFIKLLPLQKNRRVEYPWNVKRVKKAVCDENYAGQYTFHRVLFDKSKKGLPSG